MNILATKYTPGKIFPSFFLNQKSWFQITDMMDGTDKYFSKIW